VRNKGLLDVNILKLIIYRYWHKFWKPLETNRVSVYTVKLCREGMVISNYKFDVNP